MSSLNIDPNKAKPDNSYFASMKKKFPDAPNFVVYLKPDQIQRSARERIFREMVKGQIDYTEYGQYFLDSKFLENLIIAAEFELNNNSIDRVALAYYDLNYFGYNKLNVISRRAQKDSLCYVYSYILSCLYNIKATGNIGAIANLQYELSTYRNVL